jgi:hypothetical protein
MQVGKFSKNCDGSIDFSRDLGRSPARRVLMAAESHAVIFLCQRARIKNSGCTLGPYWARRCGAARQQQLNY